MGSPKQRRWSKVTHRWHRIWWSHQGRRWRLCINTTLCNPQGRPMHCISKIWSIRVGDISTAFLHAPRSNNKHPTKTTSRVLHQQEHLLETEEGDVWSQVITKSLARPSGKHHERTGLHTTHIRAQCVKASRRKGTHHGLCRRSAFCRRNRGDQQHLQQDPRQDVTTSNWWSITRQRIANKGDHFDISLDDEYLDNIFHKMKLNKCNPATTTGKANVEDEQLLDQQEHQQLRRLVGKLQWLAYTRPDISYATKELARALQQPIIKDQKKLRHLVRYLAGTKRLQIQHRTNNQAVWQDTTATRTSMSAPTEQDVIRQDEAQQALSSSYLAPASTLDHEHKEW